MLRAYFYFFNYQIKFLCPLLYLIFFKKIAQQAGRRSSSRMPLFLFYFFIFHCVYFYYICNTKKNWITGCTPRPGASQGHQPHLTAQALLRANLPPDQSGALITSSGAKMSFYNSVCHRYTPFRPKEYVGKKNSVQKSMWVKKISDRVYRCDRFFLEIYRSE